MHNREISRQIQKLQALVLRTQEACGENIEMQSHWAKYICILSAGLMENALKEIYIQYAQTTVSKPVANYVSSQISQIRNPRIDKFISIASAFKEEWSDELEEFTSLKGRREAVDSIMLNRHLIAHGQSHNSNISLVQVKEYLLRSIEVLEFIESQCRR